MANTAWKKVTYGDHTYMVLRTEFTDRITYEAFEPADKESVKMKPLDGGSPQFIKRSTHGHTADLGKDGKWGDIATKALPMEILEFTPRSPERIERENKFHDNNCLLACNVINAAFNVEKEAAADHGSYILRRVKKVALDEPKKEADARSPVIHDKVKDMLAMAAMPRLVELAKLNGVPVKDKDDPGLLKMRLGNALRHKIKKGEDIIEH